MTPFGERILATLRARAQAQANVHLTNIDLLLNNPVGVSEHASIVDTVEQEIVKMMHCDELMSMIDGIRQYFHEEQTSKANENV